MEIVSFYSFKGGVGRTSLLLNCAAYLAAKGKNVVMVDMDLHAPGLTFNPMKKYIVHQEGDFRGISDSLFEFYKGIEESKKGKKGEEKLYFLDPSKMLWDFNFENKLKLQENDKHKDLTGRLLLLDAGTKVDEMLEQSYFSKPDKDVHYFKKDEQDPFKNAFAKAFREAFEKLEFKKQERYDHDKVDYVFIDCRTGYSEILDLSLGYLSDKMVLVSGLNDQNLYGLKKTVREAQKNVAIDRLPLYLQIVFSPIPANEDQELSENLDKAHRTVSELLRPSSTGRELPPPIHYIHYTPLLVYRERPLVLEQEKFLYAREVRAIVQALFNVGEEEKVSFDLAERSQKQIFTRKIDDILDTAGQSKQAETPKLALKDSNIFSEYPLWSWPLEGKSEAIQSKEAEWIAENILPPTETDQLLNLTAGSYSLSIEEKKTCIS